MVLPTLCMIVKLFLEKATDASLKTAVLITITQETFPRPRSPW